MEHDQRGTTLDDFSKYVKHQGIKNALSINRSETGYIVYVDLKHAANKGINFNGFTQWWIDMEHTPVAFGLRLSYIDLHNPEIAAGFFDRA